MKQLLALFLAAVLVCSAAGCANTPTETTVPTETAPVTTAPVETAASFDERNYLRENLPIMDGSTSLIPLEAGIRAAIFDISQEEATDAVAHTTTWDSFYKLLGGTVDLIFSVPLSKEQWDTAAQRGVTLEAVPIAREGFVFVVNAENPVDSLTQEQIRGIYSGEITNWSQVGGLDEDIVPYQRNRDSGSQNFMIEFMGDTPLTDAPSELRPASMSGLMDVIAANDNSRASIGYSVYAYAADMYGNGNEIKFIQVDGIAPNKAAFADGSYPLLGNNYAVFNADEPNDSPVRILVDWMLSNEGQAAIAQAGYVTFTGVSNDTTEAILDKYEGVGTGAPAGEVPGSEYALRGKPDVEEYSTYLISGLPLSTAALADGTSTYRITQLVDKELEEEINAWIDEQMVWVHQERPRLEERLEALNQGIGFDLYQFGAQASYRQPDDQDAACIVTAKNGYLSVAVSLCYTQCVMNGYPKYYRTETATWDLLTGERLEAEDLFCQGVDIDQVLNDYIRIYSQTPEEYYGIYPDMKQDFAGLPTSGWHLTHDTLYFDHDNPYFAHGEAIPLDGLPDGTLASEALRDFSQCLDPGSNVCAVQQFRLLKKDIRYCYTEDGLFSYAYLEESAHPNAAKINAEVETYLNTTYSEQAIRSYFTGKGVDSDKLDLYGLDWYLENWGGKYLRFMGQRPNYYIEDTDEFLVYPYPICFLYDLETGEQISWVDILEEGWEEDIIWDSEVVPDDPGALDTQWVLLYNGEYLKVCLTDGTNDYFARIPAQYIRY